MIATEDGSEVFNPDPEVASSSSERFAVMRERLGIDGVVGLVERHRDLRPSGQWTEMFADLYPAQNVGP
jgi:hypothetical protein